MKVVALLAILASAAAPASASPVVGAESVFVQYPSTTGSFNVYISLPSSDPAPIHLGGFEFTLSTSGGATFTSVDYPASNYVYAGNSFNQTFGLPFSNDAFPTMTFTAQDLQDQFPFGFTQLNPGDKFLLATVNFTIPLSPHGTVFPFTLSNVKLSDEFGNPIPLGANSIVNGTAEVVPEPATLVVFGTLAAVGFGVRRRRLAKA